MAGIIEFSKFIGTLKRDIVILRTLTLSAKCFESTLSKIWFFQKRIRGVNQNNTSSLNHKLLIKWLKNKNTANEFNLLPHNLAF